MGTIPSEMSISFFSLGPDLQIDVEAGLVIRAGEESQLTPREVRILVLLEHTRRLTRGYLSAAVLVAHLDATEADATEVDDPVHCVQQAITRLRKKLGERSGHPTILQGRRGFGYRLLPCSPELVSVPRVEIAPIHPVAVERDERVLVPSGR